MRALFAALADLMVGGHFAYLGVLVLGGLAACRWPRVFVWHVGAVVWALGAITIRYDCPLTELELQFRHRAGQVGYGGGFLRHYVRGELFPEWMTPFVVVAAVSLVGLGWIRLAWRASGRTRVSGFQ